MRYAIRQHLDFLVEKKPLRLTLDGSTSGISYILSNINADGTETVLHFGARETTKAEKQNSAYAISWRTETPET